MDIPVLFSYINLNFHWVFFSTTTIIYDRNNIRGDSDDNATFIPENVENIVD